MGLLKLFWSRGQKILESVLCNTSEYETVYEIIHFGVCTICSKNIFTYFQMKVSFPVIMKCEKIFMYFNILQLVVDHPVHSK